MWKKDKDMGRKLNGEYLESSRVWENGVNKADFLLSIVTGKYTQALLCNRLDLHGDLRRNLLLSCGLYYSLLLTICVGSKVFTCFPATIQHC